MTNRTAVYGQMENIEILQTIIYGGQEGAGVRELDPISIVQK